MTDEHRRMHFVYRENTTMLRPGDLAVMNFDKGTVEFIAHDGDTLHVQPRHGRSVSSLELNEAGFAVLVLLLDLCTGLSAESTARETNVVLAFRKRTSLKQGTFSLVTDDRRTSFKAGDRISVDAFGKNVAFSRKGRPLLIRDDAKRETFNAFDLPIPTPCGVTASIVHQCLELFTDLRTRRLAPSDDGIIFELDP